MDKHEGVHYLVEYSKNDISVCILCNIKILKGSVKIALPQVRN